MVICLIILSFQKEGLHCERKGYLGLRLSLQFIFLTKTPFAKAILHLVALEISNKSGKKLNFAAECLGILIIR